MIKALNILLVAYLAIAPGMNVCSLLHSIELCRCAAASSAEPTAHCHHAHTDGHHDAPDQHHPEPDVPDQDCASLHVETGAMAVPPIVSFKETAHPAVGWVMPGVPSYVAGNAPTPGDARAPPEPTRVGITQILI